MKLQVVVGCGGVRVPLDSHDDVCTSKRTDTEGYIVTARRFVIRVKVSYVPLIAQA